MTALDSSTDLPIGEWRPERRDPAAMASASLAAIVASLHGRSGKTLLARALVDYFVLSGGRPDIFDTDPVKRGLNVLFPADGRVIDLSIVRDQVLLFETLAKPSSQMRLVDVTHRSLTKFFELVRDTDFISEARSRNIQPVIFYIPDRKIDSFEAGVILRDNFPDSSFVVVENAFFRAPKHDVRQGPAYQALRTHKWRFAMPRLADGVIEALEDRHLPFDDFMRQPMSSDGEMPLPDGLSPYLRIELRGWIFRVFREIHRVVTGLVTDEGRFEGSPPRHGSRRAVPRAVLQAP